MENITDENIHRLVEEYLSNSENELPRIGGWDVSNVTNMNSLFSKYKNFNEDLSRWNVCTVERMDGMCAPLKEWTECFLDVRILSESG